jgi:hypothetical protein
MCPRSLKSGQNSLSGRGSAARAPLQIWDSIYEIGVYSLPMPGRRNQSAAARRPPGAGPRSRDGALDAAACRETATATALASATAPARSAAATRRRRSASEPSMIACQSEALAISGAVAPAPWSRSHDGGSGLGCRVGAVDHVQPALDRASRAGRGAPPAPQRPRSGRRTPQRLLVLKPRSACTIAASERRDQPRDRRGQRLDQFVEPEFPDVVGRGAARAGPSVRRASAARSGWIL